MDLEMQGKGFDELMQQRQDVMDTLQSWLLFNWAAIQTAAREEGKELKVESVFMNFTP